MSKFMDYVDGLDPKSLSSQDYTIRHLEGIFAMLEKTKTDDVVLKLVRKDNVKTLDDGVKVILQEGSGNQTRVYPDGGFEIYTGGVKTIDKRK